MMILIFVICSSLCAVMSSDPLFMDLNDPTGSAVKSNVKINQMGGVESYSGLLPLTSDNSKALFFWYFPAMNKPLDAPVIIWIQGWQTPATYGLFLENGPYKVGPLDGLSKRTYAWTRFAHMVYIDSPVGTGFSFSKSDYPQNASAVVDDLFTSISNLVEFFPYLQLNKLFLGGESYAGKYVPLLALKMHSDRRFKQLQGIFLGNPFVDPATQVNYGSYLYQHGLIDYDQSQYFEQEERSIRDLIDRGDFNNAAMRMGELILSPYGNTYFNNVTGFDQYYDFVNTEPVKEFWRVFINLTEVRNAIHVGGIPFSDGMTSAKNLLLDVAQSGKDALQEVLSHYKVLVYNGQTDIVCASPMMETLLDSLVWKDTAGFREAPRTIWMDGNDVAGYIREYSKLTSAMIRDAGHMAAIDQPKRIYTLIKHFVTGSSLDSFD